MVCLPLIRMRSGTLPRRPAITSRRKTPSGCSTWIRGDARRSLLRQSRTAADAGDRSLDHSRKRPPDRRRAHQAADGGRTQNRARNSARIVAAAAAAQQDGSARPVRAFLRRRWAGIISTCAKSRRTSWAAVVADVSGKGVGSALLASLLQGTFLMASADPWHIESHHGRLNNSCWSAPAAKNTRPCSIARSIPRGC